MQHADLPPFRDIAGSLFCIVVSVAMVLYLVPWLVAGDVLAWVFCAAFCLVILLSGLRLGRWLFFGRQRCPGSALLKRVLEIDEVE